MYLYYFLENWDFTFQSFVHFRYTNSKSIIMTNYKLLKLLWATVSESNEIFSNVHFYMRSSQSYLKFAVKLRLALKAPSQEVNRYAGRSFIQINVRTHSINTCHRRPRPFQLNLVCGGCEVNHNSFWRQDMILNLACGRSRDPPAFMTLHVSAIGASANTSLILSINSDVYGWWM